MQLEDPFDTKLCTLKFIVFSTLTALASGLARKLWREWERKVGDWLEMKVKTETQWKHSYHLVKSAAMSMSTIKRSSNYQSKESTWPYWEMTIDPQTLLMNALPSFSILSSHFHCTWTTDLKACATPTNGNTHVTARRLLRYIRAFACWMGARKAYTASIYT